MNNQTLSKNKLSSLDPSNMRLHELRAFSICQNWPARPFPSQWKFPLYSKLSSQISQIVYTKENVFQEKLIEKAYFIFGQTGRAIVWTASSDKWKAP